MKIGIINPNIIENDPYVGYYTDVFDGIGVDYKYIGWNRNHLYPVTYKSEKAEIFHYYSPESNSNFRKIYDYWLFSRFVIKCLKKEKYDFLTIHTLVNSLFLSNQLKRNFTNKYVFDVRDYSPIYPFVKNLVKNVIQNSAFTVISSSEYKTWLPRDCDYLMGHNVKKSFVERALGEQKIERKINKEIVVLTIGQISNFSANSRLISSLGNKPTIKIVFAGHGSQKENLELFSKGTFSNVFFSGKYQKEEEPSIVKTADFINIVLPNTGLAFNTPMSNRFYLSLLYKIPMIVNEESVQAKWVKEFHLGFVVTAEEDIYEKLMKYKENFDLKEFTDGCLKMLSIVHKEINVFENSLKKKCQEFQV